MTREAPMEELIERLERATGPDRELDMAIAMHIWKADLPNTVVVSCPAYTASLDAALTLLSDGWFLHDLGECVMPIRFKGDRHEPTGLFQVGIQHRDGGRMIRVNAKTMPNAVSAAALRARLP